MCGMALLLFGAVKQPGMTAYAAETQATQQAQTQSPRWEGQGDQWRVRTEDGKGYLTNCWFQDDVTGHWYMLGAGDGTLMYAGLVTDQATGKTYLLNTNHDGTYGRMVTTDGAYSINERTVYVQFDQNHNGTFGAITSGLNELRSTGVQESTFANIPTAGQQTQGGNGSSNGGSFSNQNSGQSQQDNGGQQENGGSEESTGNSLIDYIKNHSGNGGANTGFGNNSPSSFNN